MCCLFCLLLVFISCGEDEETASPSPPVDPTTTAGDRKRAVDDYLEHFLRASAKGPWNGSVDDCRAGDTPAAARRDALKRINYFRRQVGYTKDLRMAATHEDVQQSALIMKANNKLSHAPPNNWKCWTQSGYEASSGNLTWTSASVEDMAVGSIPGFMEDPGDHNKSVGHRAWFLYPAIDQIKIGSTSSTATVWWTIADAAPEGTPEFVSWPPEGYVIDDLVYPRWSMHVTNIRATAQNATVKMTDNQSKNAVALSIVHRRTKNNTSPYTLLTWEPKNLKKPGRGEADLSYTVKIEKVSIGEETKSYTYVVTLIDAEKVTQDANLTTTPAHSEREDIVR